MNEEYPYLLDGDSLHYMGERAFIIAKAGNTGDFDELQTDIIEQITGNKKLKEIYDVMIKRYEVEEDEIEESIEIMDGFVQNLKRSGVIKFSKDQIKSKEIRSGERGSFFPYTLNIELTESCNLRCTHCYQSANSTGSFISIKDIEKISKFMKGKVRNVVLTGGEPTIHPEINEIIDVLHKHFEKITMITNATNIHKLKNETIKKVNLFQLSIYGTDELEYNQITKVKSGYINFKEGIKRLLNQDGNLIGSVVLNNTRVETMRSYAEFCISHKIPALRYGVPVQIGRAIESNDVWGITNDEEKNMEQKVAELSKEYKERLNIFDWYDEHSKREGAIKPERGLPCGAGYSSLTITSNGRFKICQMLPKEFFESNSMDELEDIIGGRKEIDVENQIEKYKKYLEDNGLTLESACARLGEY